MIPPQRIIIGQAVKEGKRELAKTLRQHMTPAETALWHRLRRNQLDGWHFRRQQIISGLVADFYCHAAALAVEIDGSYHEASRDAERDRIIARQGIYVLRFSNDEVLRDMERVLARIKAELAARSESGET